MSMTIIDNFSLKGKSFMDGRQGVATMTALKAIPETDIPDGFRAYCAETKLWYEYNSANSVDATTGRWRSVDATTSASVDAKIKAAVTDKLGEAGGIATLDSNGLIPSHNLPGYVDDVIDLAGFVAGVTASALDNGASLPAGTEWYYDTTAKRVVLKELTLGSTSEKYRYWATGQAADDSLIASTFGRVCGPGGTPLKGKIYVDTSTNRQYRWSGTQMVELGKQMALGAVEGTGNVITEIAVEDNVIKPKKGATMIPSSQKGAANGVATLDQHGSLPMDQMPGGAMKTYLVDEIIDSLPAGTTVNSTENAPVAKGKIVYIGNSGQFVSKGSDGSYSSVWVGHEAYGSLSNGEVYDNHFPYVVGVWSTSSGVIGQAYIYIASNTRTRLDQHEVTHSGNTADPITNIMATAGQIIVYHGKISTSKVDGLDNALKRGGWNCLDCRDLYDGSSLCFRLCKIDLSNIPTNDTVNEYLGIEMISVGDEAQIVPIKAEIGLQLDRDVREFCHVLVDKPYPSHVQDVGIAVQLNSDKTVDVGLYMSDGTGNGSYGELYYRILSSPNPVRITQLMEAGGNGYFFDDGIADGSIIQGEIVDESGRYSVSVYGLLEGETPSLGKKAVGPVYVEDSDIEAIPVAQIEALFA